ncbi:MAG: rRNA maturation RNase YbeY [Phycisphaerales bacterium]|nr:rRNA maturation RNase YbeY [Phycisphaerales bacterium]
MSTTPATIEVVSASPIDEGAFLGAVARMIPLLTTVEGHPAQFARASFRIVHDPEMTVLHERHSKVAGTTDVLTFVWSVAPSPIEVDIAISCDEAARRAKEFGHPPMNEILLYALHGLLHAAGFNDHEEASHARIHAEEDRILVAIGVGPVYSERRNAP